MSNITQILLLLLLAITFIQSGYDKLADWKGNIEWLKGHFAQTPIRNMVPTSLMLILLLEIVAGILCVSGGIALALHGEKTFGLYGAVVSCITLLFLLLGQRMAKDYDGARTIVIYFVPAIFAVFLLS